MMSQHVERELRAERWRRVDVGHLVPTYGGSEIRDIVSQPATVHTL
jgi:hypothetical protein